MPRTLVDLAADLTVDALARAWHEAGVRYRVTPRAVEAVLERRPTSRGAKKLRLIMQGDVRVALSKLEARFLERGDDFRRYTYGDVFEDPEPMLRELRSVFENA